MRLLSASALWWLLLSAVIIFFYLLKLKRKRRVVPSVLLWQLALEEIEANAPFKKLRRSLLLLLQLAALAALVFALARPLVLTRALASGSTIIVIDSTASMSARDEGNQSRLDRAKALAREMTSVLGSDGRAAIIESSSRVAVRSPLTLDRAALARAIDEVRETDAAGTLADAILLAEQIAKAEPEASIVVISDGGSPAASTHGLQATGALASTSQPSLALRFIRVGQRRDNAGIIAMNSRPAQRTGRQELFASIANFSDRDREVRLELRVDGNLIDARTLSAAAASRSAMVFDGLPQAGGLAELKLVIDDDLAADNVAYTFLPNARRLRVGVAGDNPFLLQALAVNPDFYARALAAGADPLLAELDCIVSEGPLRADVLESKKPLLVINPDEVAGMWQAAGASERPEVTSFDRSHPVNSYLNYADLHIESAVARSAAAWLKPIASSGAGGLIWAGEDADRRVVMVGFDLAKSDLPLKVEFPILLANSISWLTGRDALAADRSVRAGQAITITSATASASLTTPGGDAHEIEMRESSAIFADTMRVGLYEVKGAPSFAVSLLSESESDTAPRDSIQTRAGEIGGQPETFRSEREAWRWVALIALAILAIEWWVYHKRVTL